MYTDRLSSNSEELLLQLVDAKNPTDLMRDFFKDVPRNRDEELRGIIHELVQHEYIKVSWASNLPYRVVLSNSARTYREQRSRGMEIAVENEKKVFISHRSTDAVVAEMVMTFLVQTGIPRDCIFCSSLPGNDINEKISAEVKTNLKLSVINIAILSRDYYQSAYCLNEAGVLWYCDAPVIPIALPEITPENMYGFLNNEYKIRRLDCSADIAYVYDAVRKVVGTQQSKASIIDSETRKLIEQYKNYVVHRQEPGPITETTAPIQMESITTDDERIVLHYILEKEIRKVNPHTTQASCHDE